jgi:hypothetical protein
MMGQQKNLYTVDQLPVVFYKQLRRKKLISIDYQSSSSNPNEHLTYFIKTHTEVNQRQRGIQEKLDRRFPHDGSV